MILGAEGGCAEVTFGEENCDKAIIREGSYNAVEEEEGKEGEEEGVADLPWERGYAEQTNYQTCSIYQEAVEGEKV
jgi:hypothetical protein